MRRIIIMIGVILSVETYAVNFETKMEELFREYLGERVSVIIFGKKEKKDKDSVLMPKIPKVVKNATSTEGFVDDEMGKGEKWEQYNIAFLEEAFKEVRGSRIEDHELSRWMNVMDQGATREGVYRALVHDDQYRGLQNFKYPVADLNVEFIRYVLQDFLDRDLAGDKISKFDFYSLKRIITEKFLEVADTFILTNKEDFYDWYAVVSSELAKTNGDHFKNKLRKIKSRRKHKMWAKSVPIQFVKSEIILKLHIIMNSKNKMN